MKKSILKIFGFIICIAMAFSMVACGETANDSSSNSQAQSSVTSATSENNSANSSAGQSTVISSSIEIKPIAPSTTQTTIFMVGDSTVCEYTAAKEASRYYMRNGYGMRLGEYLTEYATINNLALSGRSSKSFLAEANYQTLKTSIKAGDYLIIGFGHNDEKFEANRYTDPSLPTTEPTSFKYHLYEYYIKVAQQAGATPILCTPIVRRSAGGSYSGSTIHQVTGSTAYNGGDYSKCIIELGLEKGVDVIDLTTLTKNYLTGKSVSESAMLYSWNKSNSSTFDSATTTVDNTHLNAYGAQIVAKMFVEELNTKTNNSLRGYIKAELPTPSTDVLVPSSAIN